MKQHVLCMPLVMAMCVFCVFVVCVLCVCVLCVLMCVLRVCLCVCVLCFVCYVYVLAHFYDQTCTCMHTQFTNVQSQPHVLPHANKHVWSSDTLLIVY